MNFEQLHQLRDQITTEAFGLWWQHHLNASAEAVSHFTGALPALGQVNGRTNGMPLFEWLCHCLHAADHIERGLTAKALDLMGAPARQHSAVLLALVAALHDVDGWVRVRAADVLQQMGKAGGSPDMLQSLVRALQDADSDVRSHAAEILGCMGRSAVSSDVLAALVNALRDEASQVRSSAASALSKMDEAAASHPDVLIALEQLALRGDSVDVDQAFDKLREAMARHPDVLQELLAALSDMDGGVRSRAAKALGRIGEAVANQEVLSALTYALRDSDGGVRIAAAGALEKMGEAAQRHNAVVPALMECVLHSEDEKVRSQTWSTLRRMSEAAAQYSQSIPALLVALRNRDWGVRQGAAYVLDAILKSTVQQDPLAVNALVETALRDGDGRVCYAAVTVLEGIAPRCPAVLLPLAHIALHRREYDPQCIYDPQSNAAGAFFWLIPTILEYPSVLSTIADAVSHNDRRVRRNAVEVLEYLTRGLNGVAATEMVREKTRQILPQVLAALVTALHDEDRDVRLAAANVLKERGQMVAQDVRVIDALVSALRDEYERIRQSAAEALAKVGAPAAQHQAVVPALVETLRDDYWFARETAAWALGEMGEAAVRQNDVIPALVTMVMRDNWRVRVAAVLALGQIGEITLRYSGTFSALVGALQDEELTVRSHTVEAVCKMGRAMTQNPDVLAALVKALDVDDPHGNIRDRVAKGLHALMKSGMRIFMQNDRMIGSTIWELSE
ncbi:MAG: HEAT repeat domain-containing protein [Verrucomicrobia bacterium]|nr:HEAT repeat domain-containing protein [Verrucomicrobiota bacterium]